MTATRLAPRDVRALTVGVVALVILIGVPRGGRAWLTWRAETLQAATEMTHELARTKAMIAGLETALDSAEKRVARFRDAGSMLFVARKPADAAAALAATIREAAGPSIRVVAIESRTDTARTNTLRRVTATVQAHGDVTGLAAMMQLLESRRTVLALRTLSMQPQSVETPQDAVELLDIRFTAEALALITEGEKKP
jgi:hypothetical protein